MCLNKMFQSKKTDTKITESEELLGIEYQRNFSALDNEFARLPRIKANLRTNKLICLILSHVDFFEDNTDENGDIWVSCNYKEIRNFIQTNNGQSNMSFLDIARSVVENSIVSGKVGTKNVAGAIISTVIEDDGKFAFKINGDFKPYVQQLKSRYTMLKNDSVKSFKSNYAFMLYQELKSRSDYSFKGKTFFYSMDHLYKIFCLTRKDYRLKTGTYDWYNFEKRVLERCKAEISFQNDLRMDYKRVNTKDQQGYNIEFVDVHKWNLKADV